nr:hypothetical protein [uncultured Blautia sp.]
MCKLLEEMREEAATKATKKATYNQAVSIALKMLEKGYSVGEIAELNGLSLKEVQELANKQTV